MKFKKRTYKTPGHNRNIKNERTIERSLNIIEWNSRQMIQFKFTYKKQQKSVSAAVNVCIWKVEKYKHIFGAWPTINQSQPKTPFNKMIFPINFSVQIFIECRSHYTFKIWNGIVVWFNAQMIRFCFVVNDSNELASSARKVEEYRSFVFIVNLWWKAK